MLAPKKTKFRKSHKCFRSGNTKRGANIEFGSYALKAVSPARINSRQIEAARRAMTRFIKRGGKVWIRVFPDQPITKKGVGVGMGGGKGSLDHFAFQVRPGRIIFEMDGVTEDLAREALRLGAHKLPFKTKIIVKKTQQEVKDED